MLEKFNPTAAGEQSMLVTDTDEYVKSVLRKALGEDKANLLIDRILRAQRRHRHREPEVDGPGSVAELLRNEHPQIVAAILVHLESDQAGSVLKTFPKRQRNEGDGAHRHAGRHPALGAEGPERGDEQGAGRRRPR